MCSLIVSLIFFLQISKFGPIACGIAVPQALENYTSGLEKKYILLHTFKWEIIKLLCSSIPGVFVDTTKDTSIVHDISVVGYGVDKETGTFEISNSKVVLSSTSLICSPFFHRSQVLAHQELVGSLLGK